MAPVIMTQHIQKSKYASGYLRRLLTDGKKQQPGSRAVEMDYLKLIILQKLKNQVGCYLVHKQIDSTGGLEVDASYLKLGNCRFGRNWSNVDNSQIRTGDEITIKTMEEILIYLKEGNMPIDGI